MTGLISFSCSGTVKVDFNEIYKGKSVDRLPKMWIREGSEILSQTSEIEFRNFKDERFIVLIKSSSRTISGVGKLIWNSDLQPTLNCRLNGKEDDKFQKLFAWVDKKNGPQIKDAWVVDLKSEKLTHPDLKQVSCDFNCEGVDACPMTD